MAYIIHNDGSYTRADFVSALSLKQDALVSGTNIKTINGSSVLGSGNLVVSPREYEYNLTQTESALHDDAISRLQAVNPQGKCAVIGLITDLHESEIGGGYSGGGNTVYTTCEQSVKLLGSIAYDYGVDAVIALGDYACGDDVDYNGYTDMMDVVVGYFDEYVSAPYLFIDGNHDRTKPANNGLRTNDIWLTWLKSVNQPRGLSIRYMKDRLDAGQLLDRSGNAITLSYIPLAYDVDIVKGNYHLHLMCLSNYDRNNGTSLAALNYTMSNDNPLTTVVSTLSHDVSYSYLSQYYDCYLNGTAKGKGGSTEQLEFPAMNGGVGGMGVIGRIGGHLHQSSRTVYEGYNQIRVANAFCVPNQIGTDNAYCFSFFVVDFENGYMTELQIGRGGGTYRYHFTVNNNGTISNDGIETI